MMLANLTGDSAAGAGRIGDVSGRHKPILPSPNGGDPQHANHWVSHPSPFTWPVSALWSSRAHAPAQTQYALGAASSPASHE